MPLDKNVEMKTPEKEDWPVLPEDVYQVEITDLTAEQLLQLAINTPIKKAKSKTAK